MPRLRLTPSNLCSIQATTHSLLAHSLHSRRPPMRLRLHSPDPNSEPNPSGSANRGGQARTSTSGSAEIRSAKLAAATPAPHTAPHTAPNGDSRLNLLLTYGGWRENAFADQIPLILNRIGIRCFRAESGDEASDVIRREHKSEVARPRQSPRAHAFCSCSGDSISRRRRSSCVLDSRTQPRTPVRLPTRCGTARSRCSTTQFPSKQCCRHSSAWCAGITAITGPQREQ